MRVTVLGCAGSIPTAVSPTSSYLIEADGYKLLLDLGNGAYGALERHTSPFEVNTVILSHLHPDHCADVASLLVARCYYPPEGRKLDKIDVHGPAGTAKRIRDIAGPGVGDYADESFTFCTLLPGEIQCGPFKVTVARVNHPVETFASRIEYNGKIFVYSADTGPTGTLVDLARGADIFLAEATYTEKQENPPDVHLTGRQAGEHAQRAGVKRLILTHLVSSVMDPLDVLSEATQVYAGDAELARPGAIYEL